MVRCFVWLIWPADIWWMHDMFLIITFCSLTQEAESSTRGLAAMWQCSVALWTMMPQSRGRWMGQMWRPSGERKAHDLSSWRWTWVTMACTAVSRIPTANGATRSYSASDVSSFSALFPSFSSSCLSESFSFTIFSALPGPMSFLTVWPYALFTKTVFPLNKLAVAYGLYRLALSRMFQTPSILRKNLVLIIINITIPCSVLCAPSSSAFPTWLMGCVWVFSKWLWGVVSSWTLSPGPDVAVKRKCRCAEWGHWQATG